MRTVCLLVGAIALALVSAGCKKKPAAKQESKIIKLPPKPTAKKEDQLVFHVPPPKPKKRKRKPLNLPPQEKIKLHADFPRDVLIPEGATLVKAEATEVSFQTAQKVPALIETYDKWMKGQGWTGEKQTAGLQQILTYKKGERTVTVEITDVDGEITVLVSTSK